MTDLNSHEHRRPRPQAYPGEYPVYPAPQPPQQPQSVYAESISFKAVTVIGLAVLIVGMAGSAVVGAMAVQEFLSENKNFRNQIVFSVDRLTSTVEKAEMRLNGLAQDPDFVRMRDLADFCLLAQQSNPSWSCPAAYQLRPGSSVHLKGR